jgi:predicted ABC-type transport system involved in lysophospholipase L1 biosynthesis ATPase subunit
MSQPILRLSGLRKTYPGADGAPDLTVLDDLDLELAAGESLAVVGPSGCGKSTLLNIVAGLDRPTAGSIEVDGRDLASLDDRGLAAMRNRTIGLVFQFHHLLPQLTIHENAVLPALVPGAGHDVAAVATRADELLARVGLQARRDHRPAQLSGGERQRAALVRALILRPRLLLADEPTGSLDETAADSLADLLAQINTEDAVTLLIATHSPALAARQTRRLTLR